MGIPVIGLTTYHGMDDESTPIVGLNRAYVDALIGSGAAPVLIPSGMQEHTCRELFNRLDGIVFTGGGDVDPDRFHGEKYPKIDDVDLERDDIELRLLMAAVVEKKPFLGICRGLQLINVGLGGTLYTHIPAQLPLAQKHDFKLNYPRDFLAHSVRLVGGTHLADILDATEIMVNSMHHQGVKDIAGALHSAADSPDGLVEGIELPDHPFGIAVQWHPECIADQPSSQKLFHAFVDAARHFRVRR
jgi:putative glutamine amidotransferase